MKKKLKYFIFTLLLSISFIKVDAATGLIDIYTSSKKVVVGNSITVTVYCKSSTPIGTCEYTLSYDSSKLKLTSGDIAVADVASNANTKSMKRTYTFKVIASGTSSISAKYYAIRDFSSESQMSSSVSPTSVTGITQKELEASYSTNNYLKSLGVSGYNLTPSFNKNTSEYKITLDPNVEKITINASKEDNTAAISGTGTFDVSLGENKFVITVTSQKGTKRTYTIIATVIDSNPINVTINDKNYTVIKKESILEKPDTFESTKVKINDIEVPGFYSEITNYYLVGLKDNEGNIILAKYNEEDNSYELYEQYKFNSLTLNIIDKQINNYYKDTITIGENNINVYKYKKTSKFSYFYALNIETGEINLYQYDEIENTVQLYNNEEIIDLSKEILKANQIIYCLAGTIVILSILVIIVASSKKKKKRKKKNKTKDNDLDITKEFKKKELENDKKDDKIKVEEKHDEKKKVSKSKKSHDIFEDW